MTTLPRFCCRFFPVILALLAAFPAQASFIVNPDGTVSDTVTGLMWDQCSWGQGDNTTCTTGAATTHSWTQALGVAVTANGASYKGYSDWRLPNINELESLADLTRSSPSIDTTAFPNTPASEYWSSTNYAPGPALAWGVYFYGGGSSVDVKAGTHCVRLVRSGQLFDSFDTQAADTTPDAFSFTAQTGAALSSVATSTPSPCPASTARRPSASQAGPTRSTAGAMFPPPGR